MSSADDAGRRLAAAVLIPVFNHAGTVGDVALAASSHASLVVVVDDGSTDGSADAVECVRAAIERRCPLEIVRLPRNAGKGAALLAGFDAVARARMTHALVMDADGQHRASDCPLLLREGAADPGAIVIGVRDLSAAQVPASSRFGRAMSNFWTLRTTGRDLPDTQSGFRLYPVAPIRSLALRCRRYDFEVEVVVRALWAGIPVRNVAIDVHYPPREERISHFRSFADNVRISALFTRLVFRRMFPTGRPAAGAVTPRPERLGVMAGLRWLRAASSSGTAPAELALAIAAGAFVGASPLWGLHTILALYVGGRLHLNLVAVFIGSNVSFPLFAPYLVFASIQTGHLITRGSFAAVDAASLGADRLGEHLVHYLIGAFPVAAVVALVLGSLTFVGARVLGRRAP